MATLECEKFVPFSGMEDLHKSYVSTDLFPLFYNRLLSSRRPEYPKFIQWLGLSEEQATPMNILARSGGLRGTDQLQMFRKIEVKDSGDFEHFFFVHGLSHLSRSAQKRVDSLNSGERLFFCFDCQNEYDPYAVLIRADNPAEVVGYCPRYIARDIRALLEFSEHVTVNVEKLAKDAPTNYRLMCKVVGKVRKQHLGKLPEQSEFVFTV
ncbi:HIRAN domain-containing protein [Vibrio parahaemolyticus]|nr:HIRAN domain-containing protein [Vibrio parahaemolyticus]